MRVIAYKQILRQRGLVLVVGLIFLMILTMIGITTMSSTSLTEKMTQNMRDASTSFAASEAALGDGEAWLQSLATIPTAVSTCATPPCQVWTYNALGNFYQSSDSWWQTNALPFSSSIYGLSMQPYYIIEQYGFVPYDLSPNSLSTGHGYYYFRVTSRGSGATNTAHSVVQSIYATQFN